MNSGFRSIRVIACSGIVVCIALGLVSTSVLAQPGQGRDFGGFGQPGVIPFAESNDPRVENRSYHFADTDEDLPYCVFVSSKVEEDTEAPLIISLHGLGIGPGFMCQGAAIDLAEEGGYILAAPLGYSVGGWYGSPVMNMRGRGPGAAEPADLPEGPDPVDVAKWSEQDVFNVLAMVRNEFNIDDDRTYLMGHSMGGAGTFFLGSKHADEWAAIAPIAPASFLMNENRAEILQGIRNGGVPVMVVHGDMDEAVPVDNTRMWVATMEELGLEHEYVEVPGATHGPIIDIGMPDIFAFFGKYAN